MSNATSRAGVSKSFWTTDYNKQFIFVVAQSHSSLRDAITCGQEKSDEIVTKLVTLGDAIESLAQRLATLENTITTGESDRPSQETAQVCPCVLKQNPSQSSISLQ